MESDLEILGAALRATDTVTEWRGSVALANIRETLGPQVNSVEGGETKLDAAVQGGCSMPLMVGGFPLVLALRILRHTNARIDAASKPPARPKEASAYKQAAWASAAKAWREPSPEQKAALEARRQAEPDWAPLIVHSQRLADLSYPDIVVEPHADFVGPLKGRRATRVEWLIWCPRRCAACRVECRASLARVRDSLVAKAREEAVRNPCVTWKIRAVKQKRFVNLRDGQHSAQLTGVLGQLFLEVAAQPHRHSNWMDILKRRVNAGDTLSLKPESFARTGRRVRSALGPLGRYWESDASGAVWKPPADSGEEPA